MLDPAINALAARAFGTVCGSAATSTARATYDDAAVQGVVLRILLRAVERCLRAHSPGCSAAARLGAVAFIHRFGAALNEHLHFHCCIRDGVFESAGTTARVIFRAALGLEAAAIRQVQARVRQQVLRAFVRRGLLDQGDADEMGGWEHGGGFSLDAAVRIEGADRAGRERLLRYCARPPFALAHLHQHDAEHLVYHCPKPRPGGPSALVLTPLELIDKIAAPVPPPRTHRHRYYGVLGPNAPSRAAVTALAPVPVPPPPPADPAGAQQASAQRAAARYLWALLLARIFGALPLTCPFCHASMRIIAFINGASAVRRILDHLGEATRPPRVAPARGPPLWEAATAAAARNDQAWGDPAGTGGRIRSAHHLQLEVVAKGVETEPQAGFLRRCRCDIAQGFLFGAPMQAAYLKELLDDSAGGLLPARSSLGGPVPTFPLAAGA